MEDEDDETNWLNNERKEKLSNLLDETQGWKKLAKRVNFEYLLQSLHHNTSSPSLLLLNYIDVCFTFICNNTAYIEASY